MQSREEKKEKIHSETPSQTEGMIEMDGMETTLEIEIEIAAAIDVIATVVIVAVEIGDEVENDHVEGGMIEIEGMIGIVIGIEIVTATVIATAEDVIALGQEIVTAAVAAAMIVESDRKRD